MNIETMLIEFGFAALAIAIAIGAPLFGMTRQNTTAAAATEELLRAHDTDFKSELVSS